MLTAILTLHVLPSAVHAANITGRKLSPVTVDGEAVHVGGTHGVVVNGAHVTIADIACTNGVIHVIDAILLPKA